MNGFDGSSVSSVFDDTVPIEPSVVSGLSSEIDALNSKLDETASKIDKISSKANPAVKKAQKDIATLTSKSTVSIRKVFAKYTKLLTLFSKRATYRALNAIIDAITSSFKDGMNAAYQYSKLMEGRFSKSLDTIATSTNYLKNALGAMASPLINMLAPVIDRIVDKFVEWLNVANQVFARLSGESTWMKAVKVGAEYADAIDAATDANKAFKSSLMGFDELNVISDNSNSGSSTGDNAGYDFVREDIDTAFVDAKIAEWSSLLGIVGMIGAGIASWKIATGLEKALEYLASLNGSGFSITFGASGLTMLLTDLGRLKNYLKDIVENGANFTNTTGALGEFAGSIGDVLLLFGQLKWVPALKALQGILEIVSAANDIAENGFNFDKAMTVVRGLSNLGFAIGVSKKNWKKAGVFLALQGFGEAIEELKKNWEAIKTGDWSGVNKVALATAGVKVLAGLALAMGQFGTIKGLGKTAGLSKSLSNTDTVNTTVSQLTGKLKTLTKNLALGIVVIAEVAVALGLVVGAVWGLGVLLDQVGQAWQPVIDNAGTVAIAMGIGVGLLVAIGAVTVLLGTAGSSLIGYLALGIAMLALLGVSAGLFIAEIWAIGWGLDQIAIAWQPVLDNGEMIATSIGIGTALLIGIGAACALLGAAAVASVGLLPLAIGLGIAMLVEIGAAAIIFTEEITKIGRGLNSIGKAWQPVLTNGDVVREGIERGTELLIAIGAVTAILGVASIASGMLIYAAVDAGTVLLVKLSKSVVAFVESLTDVADKLNYNLHPALKRLNTNLPPLTKNMEQFTSFMKDFAGKVVDYTASSAIAGFAATVDAIIKFFTKDPIRALADDVNKQYGQSTDLKEKLEKVNPELETVIDLMDDYYSFLSEIQRLAGLTNGLSLAEGLFVNMKEVGKKIIAGLVDGLKSEKGTLKRELESVLDDTFKKKDAKAKGKDFGKELCAGISESFKEYKFPTLKGTIDVTNKGKGTFTLSAYANGGFPDRGQMFIAREAGAEMVGSIGGRTAVANNDQIVEGIYQGVLAAMQNSNNSNDNNVDVRVYLDGKQITAAVEKRQRERGATIYPGGVLNGI